MSILGNNDSSCWDLNTESGGMMDLYTGQWARAVVPPRLATALRAAITKCTPPAVQVPILPIVFTDIFLDSDNPIFREPRAVWQLPPED